MRRTGPEHAGVRTKQRLRHRAAGRPVIRENQSVWMILVVSVGDLKRIHATRSAALDRDLAVAAGGRPRGIDRRARALDPERRSLAAPRARHGTPVGHASFT